MDISIDSDTGGKRKRRRMTEVTSNIFFPTRFSVSKSERKRKRTSNNQSNSSFLSIAGSEADTYVTPKKYVK